MDVHYLQAALTYQVYDLKTGSKGLYTERGVHRPGDKVYLNFVLNDKENPLPINHPVVFELSDARGKLVERQTIGGATEENSSTARRVANFYHFPFQTSSDAPTGDWSARITVGGTVFYKTLKVANIKPNRFKIDLQFDDEVLMANKKIKGHAQVNWLHGAPAADTDFNMEVSLSEDYQPFRQHAQYKFRDRIRDFSLTRRPLQMERLTVMVRCPLAKLSMLIPKCLVC